MLTKVKHKYIISMPATSNLSLLLLTTLCDGALQYIRAHHVKAKKFKVLTPAAPKDNFFLYRTSNITNRLHKLIENEFDTLNF